MSEYVRGYAFGIIPQLAGRQMAAMLQLERQERRSQAAIVTMIVSNVAADILFVSVGGMGLFGLALATSLANWAYFLVMASYYATQRAQLKPDLRHAAWKDFPTLVKIGFPNALLVACLAARSLVLNRLLLQTAGEDGLSALSAFNMISGLVFAMALGTGAVVRMLSSVFLGEDNRESLLELIRLAFTRVMAMIAGIGIAVALASPWIADIFFPDRSTAVYVMSRQLIMIYGLSLPLTQACIICASYGQAAEHRLYGNLISVMDGFVSVLVPAAVLAPTLGIYGIWAAFPIGLALTLLTTLIYVLVRLGSWPRNIGEWLLLKPNFGLGERLVLNVGSMNDVIATARLVQEFCDRQNIPERTGNFAGLCLEEMAGNIVQHGFEADHKKHGAEIRVVDQDEKIVLRIKDDCIPFDPSELASIASPDDPISNIGIRLSYGLADEVSYQNLLGLNVLTMTLRKHSERSKDRRKTMSS